MIDHAVKQKKTESRVHSESSGAKSATIFILSIHCRYHKKRKLFNAIKYVVLKKLIKKNK